LVAPGCFWPDRRAMGDRSAPNNRYSQPYHHQHGDNREDNHKTPTRLE